MINYSLSLTLKMAYTNGIESWKKLNVIVSQFVGQIRKLTINIDISKDVTIVLIIQLKKQENY